MTREEFEHAYAATEAERKRVREEAAEKDRALVADLHAKALSYFGVAVGDIVVSRDVKYSVLGVDSVVCNSVWLKATKFKKDGTPSAVVTTLYNWSKP